MMEKDYTRRDFVKMMGVGTMGVLVGSLSGCVEGQEEMMPLDRLREYHVFKQPIEDVDGLDTYVFIREQRYLDNYMYLYLNVAEDKYFYDNVFVTLRDESEYVDLDNGVDHIKFAPLLDNFDMVDMGNAVDVVGEALGMKKEYGASEINKINDILKSNKKLVKKKNDN